MYSTIHKFIVVRSLAQFNKLLQPLGNLSTLHAVGFKKSAFIRSLY